LTKDLLAAIIALGRGVHVTSLHVGNPGAGVKTSPAFALGLPLAKTLETIGATTFGG
jgi:hypothetical protein